MFRLAPYSLAIVFVLLVVMHQGPWSIAVLDLTARVVKEGAPLALLSVGAALVIAAGSVDISGR